jgi:hypothetical protein
MMEKKWFGNKEQINPTFQGQVFGTWKKRRFYWEKKLEETFKPKSECVEYIIDTGIVDSKSNAPVLDSIGKWRRNTIRRKDI